MPKKYGVRLTDAERETLKQLISKRRVSAQRVVRAQVSDLLTCELSRLRTKSVIRLWG
jgi:hypothetical protein